MVAPTDATAVAPKNLRLDIFIFVEVVNEISDDILNGFGIFFNVIVGFCFAVNVLCALPIWALAVALTKIKSLRRRPDLETNKQIP